MFFLSESTSTDHDFCIKKIATLRQENTQLYAELGRLQTENVILKNSIEQLNIEEQLISADSIRLGFIQVFHQSRYFCGWSHFAVPFYTSVN